MREILQSNINIQRHPKLMKICQKCAIKIYLNDSKSQNKLDYENYFIMKTPNPDCLMFQ